MTREEAKAWKRVSMAMIDAGLFAGLVLAIPGLLFDDFICWLEKRDA